MTKYDSSWDSGDTDCFDEKYQVWEKRHWWSWLDTNLSFPFDVECVEVWDSGITSVNSNNFFRVGDVATVIGIELEDEMSGIIVKIKKGRFRRCVPLADLQVTSKASSNFWPVREYVVWFANQ